MKTKSRTPFGGPACIVFCGERGIRTHGPVTRTTVFETAPIDHSGISPVAQYHKDIAAANIIYFTNTIFNVLKLNRRLFVSEIMRNLVNW